MLLCYNTTLNPTGASKTCAEGQDVHVFLGDQMSDTEYWIGCF